MNPTTSGQFVVTCSGRLGITTSEPRGGLIGVMLQAGCYSVRHEVATLTVVNARVTN